jgi:hypothetical protein
MEKLLKKLKSQRGATGTDVLIAATVIVISVIVVSMLYVNTSLESRNITRTAGATRIATNIIEDINSKSYDEFLSDFSSYAGAGATSMSGQTEKTIFGTKIPKGYTLDMSTENVYGKYVRSIKVTVKYSVGGSEEKVEFSTVKQRELIGECNEPSTEYLSSSGILQSGMKFYPVKYSESAGAYIKTTENDTEWYNYTNKNWAVVIVSRCDESTLFDANGKFIGTINSGSPNINASYTQKFVWIPRFLTNSDKTAFGAFAYNSTDKIIAYKTLNSVEGGNSFEYYTYADNTEGYVKPYETQVTGTWVEMTSSKITSDANAKLLNVSKYGPCNLH